MLGRGRGRCYCSEGQFWGSPRRPSERKAHPPGELIMRANGGLRRFSTLRRISVGGGCA